MSEMMTFPDTWEEYEKFYGFADKEQVYSNGSRLIHSFRVEQWLDHLERKRGEWIDGREYINSRWKVCSICHKPAHDSCGGDNFCPNCGAEMRGKENGCN